MTPSQQEYRTISLSKGFSTIVDAADHEWITQWSWHAFVYPSGAVYAVRSCVQDGKQRRLFLHREIMGFVRGDGNIADHASGDTLDNRRANLRKATKTENNRNCRARKGKLVPYKGVSFYRPTGKFHAQIKNGGDSKSLGYFHTAEEAAEAYARAAKSLHGEFARFGNAALIKGDSDGRQQ